MKVSEILQSPMVNDFTMIHISKQTSLNHYKEFFGNWYADQVMDYADNEIMKLEYLENENKIRMEVKES